MKKILNRLTQYETLTEKESRDIIIDISEGKLNTSEISSFLTIFMIRNITIEELNGFRKALIELSLKIDLNEFDPIDLCGTGGDEKDTFNISTLASFVTAGSGVKVAKHRNKRDRLVSDFFQGCVRGETYCHRRRRSGSALELR